MSELRSAVQASLEWWKEPLQQRILHPPETVSEEVYNSYNYNYSATVIHDNFEQHVAKSNQII